MISADKKVNILQRRNAADWHLLRVILKISMLQALIFCLNLCQCVKKGASDIVK